MYALNYVCKSINVFVVQSQSCVWPFMTLWMAAHQSPLSFTSSQNLLSSCPLSQWWYLTILISSQLFLLLPSTFPSIMVFSSELDLRIRWPNYWSFSFSISSSNEYSGLISFRVDLFHLLTVHGNLKSLLQNHSSKASFLLCLAFFVDQISRLYMTNWKSHSFNYTDLCLQSDVFSV